MWTSPVSNSSKPVTSVTTHTAAPYLDAFMHNNHSNMENHHGSSSINDESRTSSSAAATATDSPEVYNSRRKSAVQNGFSSPAAGVHTLPPIETTLLDAKLASVATGPTVTHTRRRSYADALMGDNYSASTSSSSSTAAPDATTSSLNDSGTDSNHGGDYSVVSDGNSVYHTPRPYIAGGSQIASVNASPSAVHSYVQLASSSFASPVQSYSYSYASASASAPPLRLTEPSPAALLQSITLQQIHRNGVSASASPLPVQSKHGVLAPPPFASLQYPLQQQPQQSNPLALLHARYNPLPLRSRTPLSSPSPPALGTSSSSSSSSSSLDLLKSTSVPVLFGVANAVEQIRASSRPSSPASNAIQRRTVNGAHSSRALTPLQPSLSLSFPPLSTSLSSQHDRAPSASGSSLATSNVNSGASSPSMVVPPLTLTQWLQATSPPSAGGRRASQQQQQQQQQASTPTDSASIAPALVNNVVPSARYAVPPPVLSATLHPSTPLRQPVAVSIPSSVPSIRPSPSEIESEPMFTTTAIDLLNVAQLRRESLHNSPHETASSSASSASSDDSTPTYATHGHSTSPPIGGSNSSSSRGGASIASTVRTSASSSGSNSVQHVSPSSAHDSIEALLKDDEQRMRERECPPLAVVQQLLSSSSPEQHHPAGIVAQQQLQADEAAIVAALTDTSDLTPLPPTAVSSRTSSFPFLEEHVSPSTLVALGLLSAAGVAYWKREWIQEKFRQFMK